MKRNAKKMPCVMTVAGSDSGAGAGIQADLKSMAAQGVYGLTVITAVTAQNTQGVDQFQVMSPQLVEAQMDAVLRDFPVIAVKTGMLGNADLVAVVAAKLQQYCFRGIVVDPVMVAKSGDSLLEEDTQAAIRDKLLPLSLVITPNIPEAEVLCGFPITGIDDMKKAARSLHARGPAFVLLKGGHLQGEDELTDVLYDGTRFYFYRAQRINTRHTHGTGCTYASAIAAHLALGRFVPQAVLSARRYLQEILPWHPALGKGSGPMDHFAAWRQKVDAGRF
ncbi:MAG: bifunctional hydroxymethylpyrimidine kinase/phosphomethylpyrimidine kinase [Bacillota bacterium]|nr:bifunctional hydroxymethylpyrimidine kinase/phosphomethylpyrimidine kinase [Bacillota bacterium]